MFNVFAPKVKSHMIRRGASPELAEDLAIETFVKVWRKADRFDPDAGSAAAWIFRIARNTYVEVA
ncbi:MAG: hypothetical protein H7312_16950 [Tardiphaga sp.]|nr:hypothetical protein [Tardiphaga sp.]